MALLDFPVAIHVPVGPGGWSHPEVSEKGLLGFVREDGGDAVAGDNFVGTFDIVLHLLFIFLPFILLLLQLDPWLSSLWKERLLHVVTLAYNNTL